MKDHAGACGQALESVRLGPSASNRQPWRIVREGAAFHFFLPRTPGYDKMTGEIHLQEVDMGIAMCHFELAAEELGIGGNWKEAKPASMRGRWSTSSVGPQNSDCPLSLEGERGISAA